MPPKHKNDKLKTWKIFSQEDLEVVKDIFNFGFDDINLRIGAFISFINPIKSADLVTEITDDTEATYKIRLLNAAGDAASKMIYFTVINKFRFHFIKLNKQFLYPNIYNDESPYLTISKTDLLDLAIGIEMASIFQLFRKKDTLNYLDLRRFLEKNDNYLVSVGLNEHPNVVASILKKTHDIQSATFILDMDVVRVSREEYEHKFQGSTRLPFLKLEKLNQILVAIKDKKMFAGLPLVISPNMKEYLTNPFCRMEDKFAFIGDDENKSYEKLIALRKARSKRKKSAIIIDEADANLQNMTTAALNNTDKEKPIKRRRLSKSATTPTAAITETASILLNSSSQAVNTLHLSEEFQFEMPEFARQQHVNFQDWGSGNREVEALSTGGLTDSEVEGLGSELDIDVSDLLTSFSESTFSSEVLSPISQFQSPVRSMSTRKSIFAPAELPIEKLIKPYQLLLSKIYRNKIEANELADEEYKHNILMSHLESIISYCDWQNTCIDWDQSIGETVQLLSVYRKKASP